MHEVIDGQVAADFIATSYLRVNKSLLEQTQVEVELSLLNMNTIVGNLRVEMLLITSINEPANMIIDKPFHYVFGERCVQVGPKIYQSHKLT